MTGLPRSKPPLGGPARVKRHGCGCHTVWNAVSWCSTTLSQCDAHARLTAQEDADAGRVRDENARLMARLGRLRNENAWLMARLGRVLGEVDYAHVTGHLDDAGHHRITTAATTLEVPE